MLKKTVLATLMGCALMAQMMPAGAAENARTVSYLTSWGLPDIEKLNDGLNKSDIEIFMLSFGAWDSNGKVSISDGMAEVPNYDPYWMKQQYLGWTQLKYNHPEKKVMVAFGGQTYESIWSYIRTPEQRETVAKNLAELLKTPFPVYKRGLTPEEVVGECQAFNYANECEYDKYQYGGDVYLDGIDFDFEKAARLTQQENDNLLDLVKRLRALVGNEKLLSLTTYHVGADPENCAQPSVIENCSYIENARSSHNGEVTKLLQDSKDLFDFFNVMTYDAGKNFKYKVAMQNYAKAVGDKSKILVGATINSQWADGGNFVESKENNLERIKWQSENGFGGFFAWTLGSSTNQTSFAEQVSYLNEMVKVAKNTSPLVPEVPDVPEEPKAPEEPEVPETPTVELTIPDVSKAPQLQYVDYHNGGEIKLYASEDTYKKGIYKVRVNGKYVFEFSKGKSYYSSVANAEKGIKVVSYTPANALKEGDIVSLHVDNTWKSIQQVVVKKGVKYTADTAVKYITTSGNQVSVYLDKTLFNQPVDYRVTLNGKYIMETFNGKAYYANIDKGTNDSEVRVFMNAKELKKGDKIGVIRTSGNPGSTKYASSYIYTYIVNQ
ncbi:glycoside hydrolase family 18 protein [Erwinia typographi]|uniref:glycosyl hydrolase family 18 protein n=1 Tax=Erwinia typographi TaxID=371042 RepID=UPI00068D3CAB|nr:glycosyl hydrolase family 18 protein [Erwinia typographi]